MRQPPPEVPAPHEEGVEPPRKFVPLLRETAKEEISCSRSVPPHSGQEARSEPYTSASNRRPQFLHRYSNRGTG